MTLPSKSSSRVFPLLVGLLLCSNAATALIAYLVIDRMDTRYSRELSIAVPGLHEVVLLAQDSANTHRAAGNLLLARNEAESKLMWERLRLARQKELSRLTEVFTQGPPNESDPMQPLWSSATSYNKVLESFEDLVQKGELDSAISYRLDKLRPAFEQYQLRQTEQSVRLNRELMKASNQISSQANTRKNVLLGIGTFPLLLILVALVVFGVLGGVFWRQIRGIESQDKYIRPPGEF